MLFAAMLINAFHAALEDRKEALDRVGVDFAARIFASGVLDSFSCESEVFAQLGVEAAFIRVQDGFARGTLVKEYPRWF